MALYLNFTLEGETQLSRKLLFLSEKVKDWTPAFQDSNDYLMDVFSNLSFETEGREIGHAWLPLSSWYAVTKQAKYPGNGLLIASGTMKASFQGFVTPTSLTITNPTPYFKYHQSNQPRTKMPYRPMMALINEQRTTIIRKFVQYYNTALEEANAQ